VPGLVPTTEDALYVLTKTEQKNKLPVPARIQHQKYLQLAKSIPQLLKVTKGAFINKTELSGDAKRSFDISFQTPVGKGFCENTISHF
jgi:hypothetical protein